MSETKPKPRGGRRAGAGRPEFEVTDELRRKVSIAAGGGMSHEEIAIGLGIARNTLEKHFEAELSQGAYARRMEVLVALHDAASKGNVSAAKAFLNGEPAIAPPPLPAAERKRELGKKEQRDLDAKTAQDKDDDWRDLLPSGAVAVTLQ